jgi:hypothetical protein
MSGQEDRLAQRPEAGHHLPGPAPGGGVEARGRLVQEQQLGIADQRQGDVEPAVLPARQVADPVVGLIGEPDE